jgi:hypothetical protein
MNEENDKSTPATVAEQSRPHRTRSEHMRWVNETRQAGRGGRPQKTGEFALSERLKRGLNPATPLAVLHAEIRGRYVGDLGGEDNCSAMELGVCDRLADLDLIRGLLNCQRDGMKRLSLTQLEAFAGTVSKNCAAYLQGVKTIGPGRRQKDADRQIIVRRPYGEAPQASNGNGSEQGSGGA